MTASDENKKIFPSVLFLSAVITSVVILIAGYSVFRHFVKQDRTDSAHQLAAIADLKTGEIVQWRNERLGDAAVFHRNPTFFALVRRYFYDPDDADAQAQIHSWMAKVQAHLRYDRLCLHDAAGRNRMSVPEETELHESRYSIEADKTLRSGEIAFEDFHVDPRDGRVYLSILVPVLDPETMSAPIGLLIMRIDPSDYLYPLINRWPTPSPTAETLLVRREGGMVVFLNAIRFRPDAALNFQETLTRKTLPAVMAVSGKQGIVEGVDYRGEPVLADLRPIPDSPWFMVAKIDLTEVYAPIRERMWWLSFLVTALLITTGSVVGLIWRHHSVRFFKEKYEMTDALRESEERFRAMFEKAAVGIAMVDPDGRWLRVNPSLCGITGYPEAELLGLTLQDITHPEDLSMDLAAIQRVLSGRIDTYDMEKRYIRKDGAVIPIHLTVSLVREMDGTPGYFVFIVEDISMRKAAEEKLARALEELERSNRELEQFAYVASHDLQEPLRMVSSYTQLLARHYEGQLDEKAKKYIDYAVDGAVRMQQLINDLLTFARVGTRGAPFKPVDTHALLGVVIKNLAISISEARAIVTNDDLPVVSADASQLTMVFQNLMANAIKFRGETPPHIHVSATERDREWIFSVKDNGIGIDRKYADRIFVIFQRLHTREEYSGTGIGLAICKRIIARHGGRIWFESETGRGATFFFTIPKYPGTTAVAPETPAVNNADHLKTT
jgi:PAS domain S-box-containing protein